MQIICSHENLDFDGLASMIGIKKIFPAAKMVLPSRLSQPVKEFLAIYKDTFNFYRTNDFKNQEIKTVILVDTNQLHRSIIANQEVSSGAELFIYDHHPITAETPKDFKGTIEPLGATATLIVEKLIEKKIELNPVEATVLALGIYQDTGSLQFLGTTARDAKAVAHLLATGANLSVINTFLDRPLNLEQQQLYDSLMLNSREIWLKGTYVLLAETKSSSYVGGIALIARKLGELYSADVVIIVVASKRQVDIIARSRVEWAEVDKLMIRFGGGGHSKAASAKVKAASLDSIVAQLEQLLPEYISAPLTASKLMTTPVKSLSPLQSIGEAARLLLRYGHSGMPVVEEGQVVGIISRRDVDKAIHHNLSHAPVKAYMSRNVKIVQPDTPITQIEELMIENDIGRLPVCENQLLVGIVTRTDLLQTIHEEYKSKFTTNFRNRCPITGIDTKSLIQDRMPPDLRELLQRIGELGQNRRERIFLVGGIVRDLIIGSSNIDIDIVVEGSAPELAKVLAQELGAKVRIHEFFQTATISIPNSYKLDLASTRTEFYAYPAALPTIESAKLREDLYRRDFTVNAMAIALNPDTFGGLVDYFCGYSDLTEGLIRVLHNLSFVEDPTRIIRALRFATKFNWQIEGETEVFLRRALQENRLQEVSYVRLWNELKHILIEENPIPALKALAQFEVEKQIFTDIIWDEGLFIPLNLFYKTFNSLKLTKMIVPWRGYLAIILSFYPAEIRQKFLIGFGIKRSDKQLIEEVFKLKDQFTYEHFKSQSLSYWHQQLGAVADDSILNWIVLSGCEETVNQALWYIEQRSKLKPKLTGHALMDLGAQPGPRLGALIKELELAWLAGNVTSKDEEIILAQKLLKGGM